MKINTTLCHGYMLLNKNYKQIISNSVVNKHKDIYQYHDDTTYLTLNTTINKYEVIYSDLNKHSVNLRCLKINFELSYANIFIFSLLIDAFIQQLL